MKIAYLGIPGSNSYTAAKNFFGEKNEFVGVKKFEEIYQKILSNEIEYGIVPVENSLAGTIAENYDLLSRYDVNVTGEYYLKFENHLLACHPESRPNRDKLHETQSKDPVNLDMRLKQITKVYSHPQPLAQCYRFFQEHPWMEGIAYTDTAAAAKYVSEQKDETLAAIGNADAAELYGLEILQRTIADDNENNFTRFFAISKQKSSEKEIDKCSLIFTLPHVPGSLVHALEVLARHELNLIKIESRPIHGKPFEYNFYVDVKLGEKSVQFTEQTIELFRTKTQSLKILGFYKSGNFDY